MLVQRNELGRSYAQMIEQFPGMARIFRNDDIGLMKHFGSTGRNISKMADRRGDHIQDAGMSGSVRGMTHNGDPTGSAAMHSTSLPR